MKYEVGDRVRIIDDWSKGNGGQNMDGKMDKWLGQVMTINEIDGSRICMKKDAGEWSCGKLDGWFWSEDMIECKVEEERAMFKKEDLRSGDIIEYSNGRLEMIMLNTGSGDARIMFGKDRGWNWLRDFNFETMKSFLGWEAVKIWRPKFPKSMCTCVVENTKPDYKDFETIWERKKVKELTVAEISKLLGYDVKVVKG